MGSRVVTLEDGRVRVCWGAWEQGCFESRADDEVCCWGEGGWVADVVPVPVAAAVTR